MDNSSSYTYGYGTYGTNNVNSYSGGRVETVQIETNLIAETIVFFTDDGKGEMQVLMEYRRTIPVGLESIISQDELFKINGVYYKTLKVRSMTKPNESSRTRFVQLHKIGDQTQLINQFKLPEDITWSTGI